MEGSASAPAIASGPVLPDDDYCIPKDIDDRILMGPFSKDKGTYSSRINQIIRQADKVPGPGKYVAHEEWDVANGKKAHVIHAGNKFPAGTRDYKPCNKNPAPAHYENKDFYMGKSVGGGDHLSSNRRILYGQMTKGQRRSFLEGAMKQGKLMPAPGHYGSGAAGSLPQKRNNKMDVNTGPITSWARELVKNGGKGRVDKEIGPDHYKPNFFAAAATQPCHAIPKARAQNFLDKKVWEKMICRKSKKEMPGPGTYNTHDYDDSKFSRGTRYLQLRGMGRCSVSGYF